MAGYFKAWKLCYRESLEIEKVRLWLIPLQQLVLGLLSLQWLQLQQLQQQRLRQQVLEVQWNLLDGEDMVLDFYCKIM